MENLNEKYIVVADKISKKYGDLEVVKDVSLKVKKGEIFGLIGPNGAGKSTIIDCILGLTKLNGGKVSVLGKDPNKKRKEIFEKVTVQLQDSKYPEKIKVSEICEMTSKIYKNSQDYKLFIKEFGLEDKSNSYIENLSGGQKQKLSVLLAMLPDPEIIFLDELTTALDPKSRREIWIYLKKLKKDGKTIFITSHYMEEVEHLCDRVCMINKGEIIIEDTVENIVKKSGGKNLEDAYLCFLGEESLGYE